MRPAGIAAIVGSLAFQAGLIVGSGALEGDSTAERLLEAAKGDADGQLLVGVLITSLGMLLLAATITFIFIAARDRESRILRPIIGMALIGGVLMAAGLILNNFSYLDAADSFAETEAAREAPAPADPDDAEDEADDRAEDAISDASGASAGALMIRGGALLFAIGFFYTSLWGMRTGLLTRFWGSLGMASAVVMALFFLYFFALVWFLAMGFMLVGFWMGGRPPAWESGTAVPWPKPGEPDPGARDPLEGQDTLEGSGREVAEKPLPEGDQPEHARISPRSGPPPQKRKRRR